MRRILLTLTLLCALLAGSALTADRALGESGLAEAGWTWPLRGEVLTPYRNGSDPYAAGQHRGIDIAGEPGDPIVAAVGGTVTHAGGAGSSGTVVAVRSSDDRFDTSYLHLSSVSVKEGERVERGGRLGSVGTSGRRSIDRPHLHFGVREAGTDHAYLDPLAFLPAPSGPEGARPSPLPLGVPAPARPGAVPVPVASGAPVPAAAPSSSPAPALGPAPLPGIGIAPLPVVPAGSAPGAAPRSVVASGSVAPSGAVPRPIASESLHGSTRRAPTPAGHGAADSPRLGLAPQGTVAPLDRPGRARAATAATPAPRSVPVDSAAGGGLDIGWTLACVGLVIAALTLGRSDDRTRAPRRRRTSLLPTLLRPAARRG